jgi:hypothetical protein
MTAKEFSASNFQLQGNVLMLYINILLAIQHMKNGRLFHDENQNGEHRGSVQIMNGMTKFGMPIGP